MNAKQRHVQALRNADAQNLRSVLPQRSDVSASGNFSRQRPNCLRGDYLNARVHQVYDGSKHQYLPQHIFVKYFALLLSLSGLRLLETSPLSKEIPTDRIAVRAAGRSK
jgi:hypothetical protein